MHAKGGNTIENADLARALWAEIETCLQHEKKRLYDEIAHYPTPIAGCDQQFNFLLERQAHVLDEIRQAEQAVTEASTQAHPFAVLGAFLKSSVCIEDELKQRIQARVS